MSLIAGIDAGGSAVVASVATRAGKEVARVRGPSCNLRTLGMDEAVRRLTETVAAALRAVGAPPHKLSAVAIGIAGAADADDRATLATALETALGRPVRVVMDTEVVLVAAFGTSPGLAVISGTGSIAYARDASGRVAHAGGWGSALGDPGSAYAIGRGGLLAAAEAVDGLRSATPLSEQLREDLPHLHRTGPALDAEAIAALAPMVVAAAESGDGSALEILTAAADNLSGFAAAALRRLDWGLRPLDVALGGGVLVNSLLIRGLVEERLRRFQTPLESVVTVEVPVIGAIRLARELLERLPSDGPPSRPTERTGSPD